MAMRTCPGLLASLRAGARARERERRVHRHASATGVERRDDVGARVDVPSLCRTGCARATAHWPGLLQHGARARAERVPVWRDVLSRTVRSAALSLSWRALAKLEETIILLRCSLPSIRQFFPCSRIASAS